MEAEKFIQTPIQEQMVCLALYDAMDVFMPANDIVRENVRLKKDNGFMVPRVKTSLGEYRLKLHTQPYPCDEDALLKITITPRPPFGEREVVDAVVDAVVDELGEDRETGELPVLRFRLDGKVDQYTGEVTRKEEVNTFTVSISARETERVRRIATRTIFRMLNGCRMVSRRDADAIRVLADFPVIDALLSLSRGQ